MLNVEFPPAHVQYGRHSNLRLRKSLHLTPDVSDVLDTELVDRFLSIIKTISAISLTLSYPNIVSISHLLVKFPNNSKDTPLREMIAGRR
jgi:hypothetical protein